MSPDAVDLQGMSVNREKYAAPESVLTTERRQVASIRPQDFPGPTTLNEVTWRFIAVDLPTNTNEAHAEVRAVRSTDTGVAAQRPNSKEARITLRALLAGRMQLLLEKTA